MCLAFKQSNIKTHQEPQPSWWVLLFQAALNRVDTEPFYGGSAAANRVMLKFDQKQIRKSKPIGLPYQGSKKKIARQIVSLIKHNFAGLKVYDLFGGGGAITAECLLNGVDVHYNDACLISGAILRRVIESDREFLKTLCISRAEFMCIKLQPEKSVEDELKLLVNSFGNNRCDYLYGATHADRKHALALAIIQRENVFGGYQKTETYKQHQFKRIEQLERLQQLQQLQQLQFTALDYRAFSHVKGAVLYCDPPYENTDAGGYKTTPFDSAVFYEWAASMAQNNVVLISSYTISDERFEPVCRFETAMCTLSANGKGRGECEKLFMLKGVADGGNV